MDYRNIAEHVGAIDYNVSSKTLELILVFYRCRLRIPLVDIAEYGEEIIPMIFTSMQYGRWMF